MSTHDFVAVGIGPFNLGLAALADPLDDLDGVFLDGRDGFDWHGGMMLDDATLQVPFLADLVTMADPTSRFSWLQFLKETGRLYPFYIRESFYPLRREYNLYCRWAADRLPSLRWGRQVTEVTHDGEAYVVRAATGETFRGRHLVLGTGTAPRVPAGLEGVLADGGLHSADYLTRKAGLQATGSITVVGSGQSAAEVYADLLADQPAHGYALHWVTRSPRFFPMEYTKLTLEMTSPEWSSHFQGLSPETRARVQAGQAALSKGISSTTINEIYDALYARSVDGAPDAPGTTLLTATEVTGARRQGEGWRLGLRHTETGEELALETDSVVLATGYAPRVPEFLDPVRDRIRWDEQGRFLADRDFAVDDARTIFVQNAEEHTHGFVAPDLGMGAMRSSVILAAMLGREVYPVEKRIAFQEFGVPDRLRVRPEEEVARCG